MSEQANLQLVKDLYSAFQRGDIQAILDATDPNIVWTDHGPASVPIFGARQGQAGVTRFFSLLSELTDVEEFEPKEYIAQGDRVVALGQYRFRVKATGKSYDTDWAMAFIIRDGKMVQFDEFMDSAAVVEAFTP